MPQWQPQQGGFHVLKTVCNDIVADRLTHGFSREECSSVMEHLSFLEAELPGGQGSYFFYFWFLFSSLCALLKSEADAVIEEWFSGRGNNTVIRKIVCSADRMKKKLPKLLLKPEGIRRQLRRLWGEFVKKRSQIQLAQNCKCT